MRGVTFHRRMSSSSEDWVMVDDDAYFYEEECPSTTDEDATEDMDPNSSADERFERLEALRRKYDSLVGRCRTLHTELEDDEREASSEAADPTRNQAEEYKENRRILALDLVRTDFSSMALEEEDGGEVPAEPAEEDDARALGLHDPIESAEYLSPQKRRCAKVMGKLLLCYSVHDPQTGYCQGMTDLIQPFVQTFRDESACFWAFATFMESARENFMSDESGIMTRLSLVKMVFSYLNEIGAESFFFSYRMILVLLRRELSVENTMLFWEVMWAEDLLADREPGVPDFLVFSIVALIMGKSHEITTSCKAESDVVYMFCNLKVNVWHMIEAARFCRKKWLAIGAPEAVT